MITKLWNGQLSGENPACSTCSSDLLLAVGVFLAIVHKDNVIVIASSFNISTVWLVGWHKAMWQCLQEVSQYLGPSKNRRI